ncbi:MAG: PAS domain S-box protein, partial [Planctomycetia bacterium]|nr:PAS domain S-box protein [Planctomycetia bacterium]
MPAVTELAPWFALGIAVVFALVQVKLRRRMTALQVDCQRLGEQIAERDRALEAVRRSEVEARTRALIADHTDNLAVLTDAAGLTEWVNAAFERVTEYTLAEVVGKTPGSVLQGPATNPRTVLYMRDCLRRGQGFKTEILNYSKSGRKYWLALEVQPLHDARGQLVRFMAIESDITERKQAEAALRESEERFRQLVNHIDEVFWILDLKKSRILYVSPAFEQVWGRPIADLYTSARLWFEAVQMDDRPRVEQAFFHTVLTQPVDEEYRIVRPDGAVRWVRDRGFPVADEAGAVYRIVGVAQDVTEARQAREALRQAKEAAETANRFKSQFLANVSHEIRTPMNGILGMTELLLRESPDERQRERLDVVKISAEALLTVIDDLLDLSRMEAGKLVAAPRPFDLYAALGQVVKLLGEAAHRRGLELACQIAPDVPRQVIGDAVRLRQVLLNLVGNAVKFTEHGGVQVRVERLDADRLCFAVSDTGIGVPPDQLARIFQPFEQAEDTTQRRFGGTGLGLSIAARLVELLGGVIEAESTPGRGSTFRFTARLEPAAVTEVALDAGPDAALCGRSVLVVETNPLQQVALCDALADAGMRPVLARDPAAVARHLAAKAARFALVAIDLDGLGAEGPALVRRLGEVFGYRGPLLLLGKRASLPGAAWRLAAPAATVLLKPFTSADLLRAAALALQPAPPALESPAVAS